MSRILWRMPMIIAVVAALGLTAIELPAKAQEQEPSLIHPAQISKGSCGKLEPTPAYKLTDVALPATGTPAAASPAAGAIGSERGIPVQTSVTDLDVKLADLLSAPYAIDVRESGVEVEDVIACGDIGGAPAGSDLAIGLRGMGTYGASGIAILHADGDRTRVTIYLAEGLAPAQATPAASANTIAVTLTEMKITSSETTFVVGRPYTFVVTNRGAAAHEMVIEKRGVVDQPLRSDDQEAEASNVQPGHTKTLTWTFTEPGDYQLACHIPGHYEAGMVLDIQATPAS